MKREVCLFTLVGLGILLLTLLVSKPGYAATYNADVGFDTEDQSMWGSGDAVIFDFDEFYGVQWNESGSAGDIATDPILGTKWGAEITAETNGKIGFEIQADFDSGSVDVTYPVGVTFNYDDTADPGGLVTISSSFVVNPGYAMATNFTEASLRAALIFDVFAKVGGKVCVVGCVSGNLTLLNVNEELTLLEISTGDSDLFLDFSPFGDLTASFPDIDTTGSLSGKSLVSDGEDTVLDIDVDLDGVATSLFGLPPLEASVDFLGAEFGYNIVDVEVGADFLLTQDFEFLPDLMVELDAAGSSLGTFEVGTTFDIDLPDGVDDPDITPTFYLDGGDNFFHDLGLQINPTAFFSLLSVTFLDWTIGPLFEESWTTAGPEIPLFGLDFELQGFDPAGADPFDLNYPPIADAGPDQVVEQDHFQGAFVTLDGSGSSDVDGDPLTYSWDGGAAVGVDPTVVLPLGGPHTITLIVNDGLVDSEPDTVDITVVDTTPPDLYILESITVEQETLDGTVVPLPATATDICDADVDIVSDELAIYPLGETVVTFIATDDSGNFTQDTTLVIVEDTTPPDVELFEPTPSILGPPNHKFVTVNVTGIASDICDLALDIDFRVEIIDVEGGDGGGKHDPDVIKVLSTIDGSGDIWIAVELRAERSGLGDGRTYVIVAEVTDDSGNTGEAEAEVFVPHSDKE